MKTTEISREQFNNDLYAFAAKWVAGLQVKLIEQADELFENEATRFMLHEYATAKANFEDKQRRLFFAKLNGREDCEDALLDMYAEKMKKYGEVLYEIIF